MTQDKHWLFSFTVTSSCLHSNTRRPGVSYHTSHGSRNHRFILQVFII